MILSADTALIYTLWLIRLTSVVALTVLGVETMFVLGHIDHMLAVSESIVC